MKKASFRSKVMKFAWQIWRNTNDDWTACMKKAWQLYKLAKAMRAGVVSFCYRKADGTIRRALGTLCGLPSGATLNGKRVTKPSYKTLAYYDIDKQSFRCFRVENLLSIAS